MSSKRVRYEVINHRGEVLATYLGHTPTDVTGWARLHATPVEPVWVRRAGRRLERGELVTHAG